MNGSLRAKAWSERLASSSIQAASSFTRVNSINGLSFYNKGAHPFHRSYVQTVFDGYLTRGSRAVHLE